MTDTDIDIHDAMQAIQVCVQVTSFSNSEEEKIGGTKVCDTSPLFAIVAPFLGLLIGCLAASATIGRVRRKPAHAEAQCALGTAAIMMALCQRTGCPKAGQCLCI